MKRGECTMNVKGEGDMSIDEICHYHVRCIF